jgi:hypothetical protein
MTESYKQHIQLLTDAEIEALYARPVFNLQEREGYFYLEDDEHERVAQWGTLKSKVFLSYN